METEDAVTASFLTLALAQLWHVFNMRGDRSRVIDNEITRNPHVWGALALCVIILGLALYVPGLAAVLHVRPPATVGWSLILLGSLTPLLIGQGWLALRGSKR